MTTIGDQIRARFPELPAIIHEAIEIALATVPAINRSDIEYRAQLVKIDEALYAARLASASAHMAADDPTRYAAACKLDQLGRFISDAAVNASIEVGP